MTIQKTDASFLGSDGIHQIYYTVYEPEKPRAILQIVHGMAEHIARYEDFALFLAENGFLVAGEEHLGHGRTGKAVDELGYYGDCNRKRGEARNRMADDVHLLTLLIKEDHPGLPCIILGHSMGSMLTRMVLALYGDSYSGAILMGTCGTGGSSKAAGIGALLAGLISRFRGRKYISDLLYNLTFGHYNDHFKEEQDETAWLSRDRENRSGFRDDPLSGFYFSASAFRSLMELIRYISAPGSFASAPGELPILLVSGAEDPVGNYGIGVDEVYQAYRRAGNRKVSMKLFAEDRHEILNELDRELVYGTILDWLNDTIR